MGGGLRARRGGAGAPVDADRLRRRAVAGALRRAAGAGGAGAAGGEVRLDAGGALGLSARRRGRSRAGLSRSKGEGRPMPADGRFADAAAMRAWLASPRARSCSAPGSAPSLEHHHVAQRRAGARGGERVVDVLEREALGDEFVELEAALRGRARRSSARRPAAAPSPSSSRGCAGRRRRASRDRRSRCTPDGGMPTSTVAPLRCISEIACSAAPATPTVTNTKSALRAAGDLGDPRGDVLGLGVDRVRRAERPRGLELGVGDVDGDDRRGAGDRARPARNSARRRRSR